MTIYGCLTFTHAIRADICPQFLLIGLSFHHSLAFFSLSICLISVSENSIIRQRNGQASSSPDVMGKRENWTDGHRGTASKFMQLTTGGALLNLSAQIIKANSS